MRIAALYDVHGNLPALDAVLEEVAAEGVDRIVIGGDVLPGPMPRRSLDRLIELDTPVAFIRGNGEAAVLALRAGRDPLDLPEAARLPVRWVAERLRRDHARWLGTWPASVRFALPGLGDVLFCHATPRSDTEIFTRQTPDERLRPAFDGVGAALVVCGHTHMQFDRRLGPLRIVNAGSVGMPFGEPGAFWVLLDHGVSLRRTSYDTERAAERIAATSYPEAAEFARRHVIRPPSEDEMLKVFGAVEPGD